MMPRFGTDDRRRVTKLGLLDADESLNQRNVEAVSAIRADFRSVTLYISIQTVSFEERVNHTACSVVLFDPLKIK